MPHPIADSIGLEKLSHQFLQAAKAGKNFKHYLDQYAALSLFDLQKSLITDAEKKSFWINTYNAFTVFLLQKNGGEYGDRTFFFKTKYFTIGQRKFSLDDIEHGILRHTQHRLGFGFFQWLFNSALQKKLKIVRVDFRIHFALNCGANSCPLIREYHAASINEQLDNNSRIYLENEVVFDWPNNKIFVPALIKWYAEDFGNDIAIAAILKNYRIIADDAKPIIDYKSYDWKVNKTPFSK